MKKIVFVMAFACVLGACSEKKEVQSEPATEVAVDYDKTLFSYKKGELKADCLMKSPMLCAVEKVIKCSIDPTISVCDKDKMPKHVFMPDDEFVGRPSEISFRAYKLKPISGGKIEVYTESTCNGKWFGLCQGNIIYVLSSENGQQWKVNNVYGVETSK